MYSSQDSSASLIVGQAAVPAILVGRAAVPAIVASKTTFDGTKLPIVYRRLITTTYGVKPPFSPKLDDREAPQFATSAG